MKIHILTTLAVIALLLQLTGCSKSDSSSPGAQSDVQKALQATWLVQTVEVDDTDQTSVYQGLTLQFTATAYTTTNGKAAWPASGTWSFASSDGKTIRRSDGLMITIEKLTDTALQLSFTLATTTLGDRASSVAGKNVFTFTKQ